MIAEFIETSEKYNMFSRGQKVLVALSGGADSMCLISLLKNCSDYFGITIEAAHVNHCIRGEEALRDENFCREFCKKENIRLHVLTANIPETASMTGESIELCARRIRYEYFNSLGADVIATAHTGSDRVETMLMNLSRGTALSGLCSIPPVRGNIVRPLMGVFRSDIEKYCAEEGIEYVTDSTNLTTEYTRNKFRHNVVSALMSINPSFEKNALRCIEKLNEEEAYLSSVTQKIYEDMLNEDGSLNISAFPETDINLQRRLIKLFLEKNTDSDFESGHIEMILEGLGKNFSVILPGKIKISVNSDKLFVDNKDYLNFFYGEESILKGIDAVFHREDAVLSLCWTDALPSDGENASIADADKISERICIRSRTSGDVIHLGKRRCSKPLKKLFNEMKIPVEDRDKLFVIADNDGLIFSEGVGIDSQREINSDSDYFLIIKTERGKNNE